jgi:hypothetical protein
MNKHCWHGSYGMHKEEICCFCGAVRWENRLQTPPDGHGPHHPNRDLWKRAEPKWAYNWGWGILKRRDAEIDGTSFSLGELYYPDPNECEGAK